ncbi:hypothetical protein [Varunaivibrio sulfuroxidans]|uniref:Uncharacterized protein n=1 Tax=Varunaivibrio sulfuroxidans TaxID=1773489 RepID=A0A4R3J3U1_9PROT|nr:hypothetical protein [Varunaivibrio sulfuroxidans]TCS59842.1 hypothetical protein EDD55_1164 [Varunaivibrio sulfuroxidans]WES32016.1 hypothetical protein P3M64_06580 [Varunaivibrio sulfuroxidans]
MKVINPSEEKLTVDMGLDDLLILNAALNEVCNGVGIFEFETRIGVNRDRAQLLLAQLGEAIDTATPADDQ